MHLTEEFLADKFHWPKLYFFIIFYVLKYKIHLKKTIIVQNAKKWLNIKRKKSENIPTGMVILLPIWMQIGVVRVLYAYFKKTN